jgi:hypothetical protein
MSWQVPNDDAHVHIASEAQYRLFAVRRYSPLACVGTLHLLGPRHKNKLDVLATGASACPDSVLATCS